MTKIMTSDDYKRLADELDGWRALSIGGPVTLMAQAAAALRLAAEPVKAGEPVAWIAFASNGFIRFWTSDKERAEREKVSGLDLRGFTLAELVSLARKPASDVLREALERCAAALQILPSSERDIIKFTGRWERFGSMRVADILDRANAALAANQSDGSTEGRAPSTEDNSRHLIDNQEGQEKRGVEATAAVAGIKPGPSDTVAYQKALSAIAEAEDMLSEHIEEYHDCDYEPGNEPEERSSLRHIQRHLAGSLIGDDGEPLVAHQSAEGSLSSLPSGESEPVVTQAWPSAETPQAVEAAWEPTDAQINSACLSFRHDYGLLDVHDRERLRFVAVEWLRAWQKEGFGCDRAEVIERCAAVVDQCNREGPYQAIAAAGRIRALLDAFKVGRR